MARLNDRNDKFVCPKCGAFVMRWQVEWVIRSSDGKRATIIVQTANPYCEHEDGSRWEMELNPADHVVRR